MRGAVWCGPGQRRSLRSSRRCRTGRSRCTAARRSCPRRPASRAAGPICVRRGLACSCQDHRVLPHHLSKNCVRRASRRNVIWVARVLSSKRGESSFSVHIGEGASSHDLRQTRSGGYPSTSKWLHWLVAGSVLVMIPIGITMGRVAKGPLQDTLYTLHKSFGILILALMVARLINRIVVGAPAPAPGPRALAARGVVGDARAALCAADPAGDRRLARQLGLWRADAVLRPVRTADPDGEGPGVRRRRCSATIASSAS